MFDAPQYIYKHVEKLKSYWRKRNKTHNTFMSKVNFIRIVIADAKDQIKDVRKEIMRKMIDVNCHFTTRQFYVIFLLGF